jgi:peptidoglycan/xylan/chitin deacetylase (PgdA/CDA1 family)
MPLHLSRLAHRLAGGAGLPHVVRWAQRGRLLIVCYHGLRRDDAPRRHWLLLPESAFARQIAFLAEHYDCLPIDVAVERLYQGALTRPTACVTFDDGYESNLTLGLPILARHRVPATLYLATGLIGTDARVWPIRIEHAFVRAAQERVDLSRLGMGTVSLGSPAERQTLGEAVAEVLKLMPIDERRPVQDWLLAELDGPELAECDAGAFASLTWAGVAELAASGLFTFGGHTVHHEIVSRLGDRELEAELAGSIDAVRQAVPGHTSRTFAYPNGRPEDVGSRPGHVLEGLGCLGAVTTTEGLNTPQTAPMHLRRLVMGGGETDLAAFAVRAAAVPQLVRSVLRR